MVASTCSRCGGRRWLRYFSETADGDFEEAFRLCHCNQESEARGERAREVVQDRTIRVVCSFELEVFEGLPGAER